MVRLKGWRFRRHQEITASSSSESESSMMKQTQVIPLQEEGKEKKLPETRRKAEKSTEDIHCSADFFGLCAPTVHKSSKEVAPRIMPDDPTVQESIECIFATEYQNHLIAPSALQQSLIKHRSGLHSSLKNIPRIQRTSSSSSSKQQCSSCLKVPDVSQWHQAPLLLRPSHGTRIKGIRYASSKDYITWPPERQSPSCQHCTMLPINNGNESECLVTDFITPLFEGTLLVRIRGSKGIHMDQPYDDNKGYFAGMNRKYQVVVSGKFQKELQWTSLQHGFQLLRPCGRLPAKLIIKGAIRVLSFFAPHLAVQLDVPRPYSLTPLGSTPQCLVLGETKIDHMLEEPKVEERTLLKDASNSSSSMTRARHRKKAFDKLYSTQSKTPLTDCNEVHTFEFLQHLISFDDFTIELGNMMGSVELKDVLDGQPLQIMAQTQDEQRLWSFDLFHECLYPDYLRHHK